MSHAPTQVLEGQVLVAGSAGNNSDTPTSLLYDLESDSWQLIPIDVHVHVMFNLEGRIVGAGHNGTSKTSIRSDWQLVEFDQDDNAWKPLGPPVQTQRLLPFIVDGKVGAIALNRVGEPIRALALAGNQWTEEQELIGTSVDPASFYSSATWTGDVLLFSGGSEVVRFDPTSNRFGLFGQWVHPTGPVVWNGDQLVALSTQSSRGWTLKPT